MKVNGYEIKAGADLNNANLGYANLSNTDLSYANLCYANLRGANLNNANLGYANLSNTDLRYADLRYADLRYANLRYANLRCANLCYANLRGANIDYSCWPLWCGSNNVKVDGRQARQLLLHFCCLDLSGDPDEDEHRDIVAACLDFISGSHRAKDMLGGVK